MERFILSVILLFTIATYELPWLSCHAATGNISPIAEVAPEENDTIRKGVSLAGEVTDLEGKKLAGIIIRLYKAEGKTPVAFTMSDQAGNFRLKHDTLRYPVKLVFMSSKYAREEVTLERKVEPLTVKLRPESYELTEVTVKAPHTRVKGDTITYDVNAFKGKGDRSIEDVIKKLPGVSVENDGTIYYNDEPINNFYIEGLNLMGNNYAVASQNINPDDISSISIYENHQSKKVLKDIKDSKNAALDLKLKKGRMLKPLGYITAGAGYGDDLLWTGNLYTMLISPVNQTIISAKGNNAGNVYSPLDRKSGAGIAYGLFDFMPFGVPGITKNRYMDNRSAYATANTLFKLKNEMTVTVNSSYAYEHDRYDNSVQTEYLTPGESAINYSQSSTSSLFHHNAGVGIKLEKNQDRFYFLEQLSFRGLFNDHHYDVVAGNAVRQKLRNHDFRVSNTLKTAFRRGHSVYEISSITNLKNTPVNNISAFNNNGNECFMTQNFKGLSLQNSESTSLSWIMGNHFIAGTDINFEALYDKIHSVGRYDDKTFAGNDISGFKIDTKISPYVKFTSRNKKLILNLSMPVDIFNIRYHDIISDNVYRHNRPYLSPRLSAIWKVTRLLILDMAAGRRHKIGNIEDFIVNPVYTTFRTLRTMGNGSLFRSNSNYVEGMIFYRSPLAGISGRLSGGYSRSNTNSISVYNVGANGSQTSSSSLEIMNKSDNSNLMFNLTKRVHEWSSSFSIAGSGMWQQRKRIRGGIEINATSAVYTATVKAETTQWNGRIIADASCVYSRINQSFGGMMVKVGLNNVNVNGRVAVFILPDFEIYCRGSLDRADLAGGGYKSNLFVDGGARYKMRKFELELSGMNLTNIKRYEYSVYSTLDVITNSYRLRPIQGILTLKYNF